MTATAKKQFAELVPKDKAGLDRYRQVVGTAARVMLDSGLPDPETVDVGLTGQEDVEGNGHFFKGIARDPTTTRKRRGSC